MDEKRDYRLIGKRIEEARILRDMTRSDLARLIEKSPSTITRYERGEFKKISTGEISLISMKLNVNPLWLEGKDVPMEFTTEEAADIFRDRVAIPYNEKRRKKILELDIKDNELSMITKYRLLDTHGKNIVNIVLDEEQKRCESEEYTETITLTPDDLKLLPLAKRIELEKYLDGDSGLVARKRKS